MKNRYKIALVVLFLTITYLNVFVIYKHSHKPTSNSKSANRSVEKNSLNIYVWGEYITNNMFKQFTKETGIKINKTEYNNNETMFAKLKIARNNPGYDIVVPSSYYVGRMAKLGMLHEIDKTKLTNLKNIDPSFLNKPFDPNNRFSIPYLWGTTGIIINTKYIKNKVISWEEFWNPKYKNKLMMLNDMRDVFSIALITLGYSANETNPQHIEKAYLKLKKLLPNIKIFNIDTIPNIYIDEDAQIGMIWSGDYKLAKEGNLDLAYSYPKEGFTIWLDSFIIVKNAPHVENAHKFINFMLRPEIAKEATTTFGYATTNRETMKLMPLEWQKDPINNPDTSIMQRGEILLDLDGETRRLYEKYWERLKLGG